MARSMIRGGFIEVYKRGRDELGEISLAVLVEMLWVVIQFLRLIGCHFDKEFSRGNSQKNRVGQNIRPESAFSNN